MKASVSSTLMLGDLELTQLRLMTPQVKIINANDFKSDKYYGVLLESCSKLIGATNISFKDADIYEGREDTVPSDYQIVGAEGEDTFSF